MSSINVRAFIVGESLVVRVPLSPEGEKSSTGKSTIIASTHGAIKTPLSGVGDVMVNVNAFTYVEQKGDPAPDDGVGAVTDDGDLVVVVPYAGLRPSSSGKTRLAGTSGGNRPVDLKIGGRRLFVGLNAYTK